MAAKGVSLRGRRKGARMATADIGVYGLGTMGSALALNLADKGFRVAVTNRETDWIAPFLTEAGPLVDRIAAAAAAADFVAALTPPRLILCMIPSGPPMEPPSRSRRTSSASPTRSRTTTAAACG